MRRLARLRVLGLPRGRVVVQILDCRPLGSKALSLVRELQDKSERCISACPSRDTLTVDKFSFVEVALERTLFLEER